MDQAQQCPAQGQLNIDHIAHFIPNIETASSALIEAGFTLTPFSAQSHRLAPNAPLTPAGSGNRCIMLGSGYLEFLTPIADTPIAQQLRNAIARYIGVHLIALGTSTPERDFARLEAAGFEPLPAVHLQREIGIDQDDPQRSATASFTVVRVAADTMAEGRIQFCQQHTPQHLWQARWLKHANGATALRAVIIVCADPHATAQRFARYTGLALHRHGRHWRITSSRGSLLFISAAAIEDLVPFAPVPCLPWIAGYVLESPDLTHTARTLTHQPHLSRLHCGSVLLALPAAVGGIIFFQTADQDLPFIQ